MMIISEGVNRALAYVAYRSFQTGYVLYRLLRQVIPPFAAILGKLNNSRDKNKCMKEIDEESSDDLEMIGKWSKHIPQEIVELILQRLPLDDYLRVGTICSSWRIAVAKVIAEKLCTPAPQLPLLMFCGHPYTNSGHCFLSISSNYKVFYKPNCPQLHWRYCAGSVEGWLIMSDSIRWRPEGFIDFCKSPGFETVKNFFLNPVSGSRIMLPSQTNLPIRSKPNLFRKVVASTVPTSPRCIVVAVCSNGDLAFCRPIDKSWTLYRNEEELVFKDAIFYDGKLYAITTQAPYFITVFNLAKFSGSCRSLKTKVLEMLPPRPFIPRRDRVESRTLYSNNVAMSRLVKDHASNELLMVITYSDGAYDDEYFLKPIFMNYTVPPRVKSIKVFKLDRLSGPRWVQVHSLGDQIMFFSSVNCMMVPGARIWNHQEEIIGNCIYFALDYPYTTSPQQGRDVGVFCLTDGSIKRDLPCVQRSWLTLQPLWFMPNPW